MKYELVLKREAAKYLGGLDKPTRLRIKKALESLSKSPPEGDIVPMKGMEDWFRLRVGSFRIIFRVDDEEQRIIIASIGPRGDIYK
jgi:mRNA interferase RelE/StbE